MIIRFFVVFSSLMVLFLFPATVKAEISIIGSWTTGVTHTPGAGANRLLLLFTAAEATGDADITSVTYGGQAMTPAVEAFDTSTGGNWSRGELWYLPESGIQAASSDSFAVTYAATPPSFVAGHAAATFQDVHQSTPIKVSATASSSTDSVLTTPAFIVDQAGMAISGAVNGAAGSYFDNGWGTSWTEGTDWNPGATMTMGSANTSSAYAAGGTDSATTTHTTAVNRHVLVAASLVKAVADSLSVSVSNSAFAFGVQPANTWLTPQSSVIINDTSVAENLVCQVTQFTDGSNNWALSGVSSGSDTIRAQWSTASASGPWTDILAYHTDFQIAAGLAAGDSVTLWLRIQTPTSTASFNQHASALTVAAQ